MSLSRFDGIVSAAADTRKGKGEGILTLARALARNVRRPIGRCDKRVCRRVAVLWKLVIRYSS